MLTEHQCNALIDYVVGRSSASEVADVLGFDPEKEPERSLELLDDAAASNDAMQVECAWSLAEHVGLTRTSVPTLIRLLGLSWHREHEGILHTLQELRDPRAVEAVFAASQVTHAYRDYDELNGIARRCTWTLADIGTPEALEKLHVIAASDDEMVAGYAKKRIASWDAERDRKGLPPK